MSCSIPQDTYYAGSGINLLLTPQGYSVNFNYNAVEAIINTGAINIVQGQIIDEIISYNTTGVSSILFLQTGEASYQCSNLEGSIVGNGIKSMIIPSGYFNQIGDYLIFDIYGFLNSGPTVQLIESRLKLGNTVLVSQQKSNISNQINSLFHINFLISCRATGVSGVIIANGNTVNLFGSTAHLISRSGVPLDLTQSYLLDFTLSGISGDASIIYTTTQSLLQNS